MTTHHLVAPEARAAGAIPPLVPTPTCSPTSAPRCCPSTRPKRADANLGYAGEGSRNIRINARGGERADLPLAELIAARMDAIIAADGGFRDWSALGQTPAPAQA